MENKSFTFTNSMYLLFNLISKWRLNKFIRKVVEYGINGTEPKGLRKTEKTVFENIRKQIQNEKQLSKVRSYAGKHGGAPKNNANASKNTSKSQDFTKNKQKTSKNKQKITTVISPVEHKKPMFTKNQIQLYCLAYNLNVDADEFYNYCIQNNVKNWRKAAEEWSK